MERQYRLRRPEDFSRLRASGKSWANKLLVVAVVRNDLDCSRFGFITSKRIGNAVKRNRARRLLREVVRQNLPLISRGWDCVIIARAPLPEANFAETSQALVQLLKQACIWKNQVAESGIPK